MATIISVPPLQLDLDAIEAAARAATPGPWRHGRGYGAVVADTCAGQCGCCGTVIGSPNEYLVAYGGHLVAESIQVVDREFMAAASPDVVLALVAAVRDGLRTERR